ncbi:MAG: hypothetical protein JNG84_08705 [Archangium sp.]|nr:hypothetical protein [Archangium sp.]
MPTIKRTTKPATTPKPKKPATTTATTAPKPAAKPKVSSTLRFEVTGDMPEAKAFAAYKGWTTRGFTALSVPAVDLVYTTDNWRTTKVLHSYSVPSPYVNGRFTLPDVKKGTTVEFALKVTIACSHPRDIGGHRDRDDLWLNNGGSNYTQVVN